MNLASELENPQDVASPEALAATSKTVRQVAVFQLGARRHYAVLCGLAATGLLDSIVTDVYAECLPWSAARWVPQQLRGKPMRRLLTRCADGLPSARVQTLPLFVLGEALRRCRNTPNETQVDRWVRQNQLFGRTSCRRIKPNIDAVYAFNGAALEIFVEANRQSLGCILDQTAAPWRFNRDLLMAEMQRSPGWEETPVDLDSSGAMIEREEKEWELADRIICGSQFVVDAIRDAGGPADKCRIVTYPTPTIPDAAGERTGQQGSRTNVLFLGTAQLRKGIQYLWDAAARLHNAAVHVRAVGPSHLSSLGMSKLGEHMEMIGSVPRSEVWRHYRWADVFVLPTLSEGSANVCHEALACGLPVVTTEAAGLPPGQDGVTIVPARNPEALGEAIAGAPRSDAIRCPQAKSVAEYGQGLAEVIVELD